MFRFVCLIVAEYWRASRCPGQAFTSMTSCSSTLSRLRKKLKSKVRGSSFFWSFAAVLFISLQSQGINIITVVVSRLNEFWLHNFLTISRYHFAWTSICWQNSKPAELVLIVWILHFVVAGSTTVLPTTNDVPSAYQQFFEHTTAMLQPAIYANLNRGTLPPPPPGLLGWPTGPSLQTTLPQPLEEVNGKRINASQFINAEIERGG